MGESRDCEVERQPSSRQLSPYPVPLQLPSPAQERTQDWPWPDRLVLLLSIQGFYHETILPPQFDRYLIFFMKCLQVDSHFSWSSWYDSTASLATNASMTPVAK